MTDSTAPLELPIGVTESKVLQQIARIESQLRKTQRGAGEQFVKQNDRIAKSFRPIASEAQGMSRATVASLQNVSYQVQDILVQIQGGQGAMRAFGQQMPQLLSGFGAGGAIAGLAFAFGTSLIPAILGATEESADFGKELEKLNALLKVQAEMADLSAKNTGELQKEYGNHAVMARQLADALGDIAKIEFLKKFEAEKGALTTGLEDLKLLITDLDAALASDAGGATWREQTLIALSDAYGLTEDQARRVVAAMDQLDAARGPADAAAAALELSNSLMAARDAGANIPDHVLAAAKQQAEFAEMAIRTAVALGDSVTLAETLGQTDMTGTINAATEAAGFLAEQMRQALGYAQSLGGFKPQYGKLGLPPALLGESVMTSSPRPAPAPSMVHENIKVPKAGRSGGGKKREATDPLIALREETQALKDQAAAFMELSGSGGDWERELAIMQKQQDLLNKAQREGIAITPEFQAKIAAEAAAFVDATDSLKLLQEETRRGEDALENLFGSVLDGADAAKKAVLDLIAEIAKAQFTRGAMDLLGLSGGGGAASFLGSLLGARAGGGSVRAGMPYLVNEATPNSEVFVPSTSGAILNVGQAQRALRQSAGGGAPQITINNNAPGVSVSAETLTSGKVQVMIEQSLGTYDRALPARFKQIQARPRST